MLDHDPELLLVVFNLSPMQADLLHLLLSRHYITTKELAASVTDCAVAVHRLNAKLGHFHAKVANRRGRGYLIEAESRETIDQQLANFQNQRVA